MFDVDELGSDILSFMFNVNAEIHTSI